MSWIRFSIITVAVFIVQTVFIPYIRIFGVLPDILLVMVAISSIIFGRKNGVIIGMIAGFMQDIVSSTVYVHTISKMVVGYIIGFIKENVLGGDEAISTVTVFIVSIISAIIDITLLYFFIGRPVPTALYSFLIVLLYSLYNTIFVPILYPVIKMAGTENNYGD